MESLTRRLYLQALAAKLELNDMERGMLRRELVTPFVTNERRNTIRERIEVLILVQKRIESKLEWARAEERLNRPVSQMDGEKSYRSEYKAI